MSPYRLLKLFVRNARLLNISLGSVFEHVGSKKEVTQRGRNPRNNAKEAIMARSLSYTISNFSELWLVFWGQIIKQVTLIKRVETTGSLIMTVSYSWLFFKTTCFPRLHYKTRKILEMLKWIIKFLKMHRFHSIYRSTCSHFLTKRQNSNGKIAVT